MEMTLHNDLVSVVIPVYNSEKFLSESIESVLNQTYKNVEIIAVDDGSTDKSAVILKKYSTKLRILLQNNQGLAVALNTGIKNMNGKWFKWFSPDDILYPNAIESLLKEAKNHPENTVVYSNWELIDEDNRKIGDFSESNFNDLDNFDFNVRLLDGQQINVNTTLIPTKLFEKGCLIENLEDPVAIDYDFFLRAGILHNTNFYLIQKPLLKYRISSNQLSHKNITKTLSYLEVVKNKVLSNIDEPKRIRYISALEEYKKSKSFTKKSMEAGLKLFNKILPDQITNKILIFYLNKIRRTR